MKNGNYSLRVGDNPITSAFDETSYLNGPCIGEAYSAALHQTKNISNHDMSSISSHIA